MQKQVKRLYRRLFFWGLLVIVLVLLVWGTISYFIQRPARQLEEQAEQAAALQRRRDAINFQVYNVNDTDGLFYKEGSNQLSLIGGRSQPGPNGSIKLATLKLKDDPFASVIITQEKNFLPSSQTYYCNEYSISIEKSTDNGVCLTATTPGGTTIYSPQDTYNQSGVKKYYIVIGDTFITIYGDAPNEPLFYAIDSLQPVSLESLDVL